MLKTITIYVLLVVVAYLLWWNYHADYTMSNAQAQKYCHFWGGGVK